MKKVINIAITILIILVLGSIVYAVVTQEKKAGIYGGFAQCVADSGAVFYGASWCPYCIEQKRLVGDAHRALPYVECSTSDRQGQTELCSNENIESYPTWEFADESRLTGLVPLETLAEKTGCELPTNE